MNDPRIEQVRCYRPTADLVPAHWREGSVVANGIHQHYYRTGGGKPPLVLLHGFLEGALSWLPAARAFEPAYDVVMLDARGHGGSSRVAGDFAPETLAADVGAALEGLGLAGVRLVGSSLGATTAALVAARFPAAIARVVLTAVAEAGGSSAAMMESPGYQAWLAGYLDWLVGLGTQTHQQRLAAALSQFPPGAPIPGEETYVAWVENSAQLDLHLVRMSSSFWRQLDATIALMESALALVRCPTLIIKSSAGMQSSGALTIREEPSDHPTTRILRFENTGHLVVRDRFDAFVETVREFLHSPS